MAYVFKRGVFTRRARDRFFAHRLSPTTFNRRVSLHDIVHGKAFQQRIFTRRVYSRKERVQFDKVRATVDRSSTYTDRRVS